MSAQNKTSYNATNNVMSMVFSVKPDANSSDVTWHHVDVGIENVSKAELAAMAARTVAIKLQDRLRKLSPEFVRNLSKQGTRKVAWGEVFTGMDDNRPSVINVARAMFATKAPTPEQIALAESVLKAQNIDYRVN